MQFAKSLLVCTAAAALVVGATPSAFAVTARHPSTAKSRAASSLAAKSHAAAVSGAVGANSTSTQASKERSLLAAVRRAAASADTVVLVAQARQGTAVSSLAGAAQTQGGSIRRQLKSLDAVSFSVPAARAASVAEQLQRQPGVASISLAVRLHTFGVPDDTYYLSQQATYLGAVTAPEAWSVQPGSPAVKIAIVDTGVDVGHPDLAGKVVGSYNAVDGSSDVTDMTGHGTFVAGVAAAVTGNGVGVAGAGNASSLLAVKVEDSQGGIYSDSMAAGITWAVDHGANVINLSLGSDQTDPTSAAAIAYAQNHGVVVVAAAGNDGDGFNAVNYPAGYPSVIAVGATDAMGGRAFFSEFGGWVTVAAPGVNIYSTTPAAGSKIFAPGYYSSGDGTSFSSPLVAGEVALLAAEAPHASAADLRSAVVASAHGYSNLGLGTGQVDFRAALSVLAPESVPAITVPAAGAGITGVVAVAAASSAPSVRFRIDGSWLGAPVPVIAGTARTTWTTWGMQNASHTVEAVDCSVRGLCSPTAAGVTVTVANASPKVTSPKPAQAVSGNFTMTATAPGGGVAFLVDGVRRGFDGSAPYSLVLSASGLADGSRTATAVECTVAGTRCEGPTSPAIQFSSKSLHPRFSSLLPAVFSPNGDKRYDATKATFVLPDIETVVASVRSPAGATVRTASLGRLGAGVRSWTWDGRSGTGARQPDGTYTISLSTTRPVGGTTLRGDVSRTARIDTIAPAMGAVSGNGATVYPATDGYYDTIAPAVTLGEGGTLTLTVRTVSGVVMRTLSASKPAGRAAITWNGRTAANVIFWPGGYRWTFTAADAAGNQRVSPSYVVNVSIKKLVTKTASPLAQGNAAYESGAGPSYCGEASQALSEFSPHGLWLLNVCDPYLDGPSVTAAFYRFTVPAAARYASVRLDTYGNTISPPSKVRGAFLKTTTNEYGDLTAGTTVTSHSNAWYNLGSQSAASLVSSSRVVDAAVVVTDEYGAPSDFDVGYAQLTVTYSVLQ